MQKSGTRAVENRRKPQGSTTLNRRYVRRPVASKASSLETAVQRNAQIRHFNVAPAATAPTAKSVVQDKDPVMPAQAHPLAQAANQRLQARKATPARPAKPTARQIKEQAIQKALRESAKELERQNALEMKRQKRSRMHFGVGRVVLALSSAVAAVLGIVYLVGTNMPDFSMRVAAMQTGIEASYPGYVPRGFSLADITAESGKVVLNFRNSEDGNIYTLTEEKSSWDSNALLSNFVKDEYGADYAIVREQGLTIYVDGSNATWVNGGVMYKLKAGNGVLTKKQISSIATSL